jgi:invasion protein IalB
MKFAASILVASAVGLLSVSASAQDTSAPEKKALDPNQVVCEKQEVLGSRLATKRVCHTRAEWAALRLADRQEIDRAQINRGMRDDH